MSCAEYLLTRPEHERTQADINRAASTHYYALFHELASMCADFMMGQLPADHGKRAWQQAYRALEHGKCRNKCRNKKLIEKFPEAIRNFANNFILMQERRHQCDYDPLINATKTQVEFDIAGSKAILEAFKRAEEIDLRAFCVYVLFDNREDPARDATELARARLLKEQKRQEQLAKQNGAPPPGASEQDNSLPTA